MNKVPQRLSSLGIGKVTSDILLSKASADSKDITRPKVRHSELKLLDARSLTVVDNWIRSATGKGDLSKRNKAVALHLPTVLKTLQRLRSTDNRAPYFALISKVQSSKISWLNNASRPIDTKGALPVEFFNEVSNMIYRISLTCDAHEQLMLSRFTLRLLQTYEKSLSQRAGYDSKLSAKFFRNCLIPIARTESVSLVSEAIKSIPIEQQGLKFLMELAFYYHSSQFTKVLHQLNGSKLDSIFLSQDEIDAFFPLLFGIIQSFVTYGDEKTCTRLITKLSKEWGYQMDPHHQGLLVELCQKYAADQVLQSLEISNPSLQWKSLQSQWTWSEFMTYLSDQNVDLFKENQDLDFLQEKLASVASTLAEWKLFLLVYKIPDDANTSLKSFAISTVLFHLVTKKRSPFVLSILEHMLYEMGYCQEFIDTGKLQSESRYSGFHCLFKTFSTRDSAILTSYTLFTFLEQNPQLPFKFTTSDFYHMMHACLAGPDHHTLYYFLFHYIKMMGSSLYNVNGEEVSWALPLSIEKLLMNVVVKGKRDDRVREIIDEVKSWFLQHRSSTEKTVIDLAFLKQVFGNEYLPTLTVKSMIALEQRHATDAYTSRDQRYSLAADLRANRRMRRMLDFIVENVSM